MKCHSRVVWATEEGQVVLVDVLGNVQAVRLNQFLVVSQLILINQNNKRKTLSLMRNKSQLALMVLTKHYGIV